MDLNDLYKLAGISRDDAPAIEPQPVEQVAEQPTDGREDMRAMIALITPDQLNQLVGEAPVEEGDEYAASTTPNPQEYKGTLGSPADLSLRRYLGANGQPVKMENVYADHKVEDISEAWQAYKVDEGEMPAGLKAYHDKKKKKSGDKEETDESIEEASVNEEPNEGNEFSGELAKAKAAGKKDFKVDGKTYKVTEAEGEMYDDDEQLMIRWSTDDGETWNLEAYNRNDQYVPLSQEEEMRYIDQIRDEEEDRQTMSADDAAHAMRDTMRMDDDIDRLRQLSGVNEAMQDEEVMAIMAKHPEEVAKMKQMGDMDTNSELYMELYRYFSDEMPIGTQKARDGDPVEYIMNALDDMGMLESKEESAVNEDPSKPDFPMQIDLAGDSIWDKEDQNPRTVTVTDYNMDKDEEGYVSVTVEHDGPWTVYTDTGFEEEISDMIGMEVTFSEQGMQEDGAAHLEGSLEESAGINRLKQLSGLAMEDVDQQYTDVLASKNQIKINAFLQGLDSATATRLTGGKAQTSKISADGQTISPSGDTYKHGELGLSKQTIKMAKPIADR